MLWTLIKQLSYSCLGKQVKQRKGFIIKVAPMSKILFGQTKLAIETQLANDILYIILQEISGSRPQS